MKTFILNIFAFFIVTNLFAQSDTSFLGRINNLEKKIDAIGSFVKKLDSTDEKVKDLEYTISKLNREIRDLTTAQTRSKDRIEDLQKENGSLLLKADNIAKYQFKFEKLIGLLRNENASFNREMLKLLEEVNLMNSVSNYDVLDNFKKISSSIDTVKIYIETHPFDAIENSAQLKRLERLKVETKTLKFPNLEKDVDYYYDIVSTYCAVTKKVGDKINETVNQSNIRKPPLIDLKKKYSQYVFLINQLNLAIEKMEYTFPYKATCTD